MGADEQWQFLGDQVGKVDKGLSVSRDTGEDKDLGPVILDVVRNIIQRLQVLQGEDKLLGLGGAAPVGLGLPVADVEVEDADNDEGGEGRVPLNQEHHSNTKNCAKQWHPGAVEL